MAVVQYTFTHKQYLEQHNQHKQYIEQHISLIRKSADRARFFARYTLAFALQLRKKHGKNTEKARKYIIYMNIFIHVYSNIFSTSQHIVCWGELTKKGR